MEDAVDAANPAPADQTDADVQIRPVDVPPTSGWPAWLTGTPISWADKPFEVQTRQDRP